jgi:small subunit ribosomal protein S1
VYKERSIYMSEEDIKMESTIPVEPEEETSEESFAELFERQSGTSGRLEPGQKVKTHVISISGDMVYVDLGGKTEGVIDRNEFAKEDGTVAIAEGDEVEAFFVAVQNGMRKLTTRKRGYSTLDLKGIRDAQRAGLPVNGKVRGEIKGGYEVSVGGVRCFCPYSQMDLKGSRDASQYVGETLAFKVLEYKEDGRNIILSRRALLEEERQVEIEKLKSTLQVGAEMAGTIRSLTRFGAFVDLGGIDGLIPMSEMSWGRTENIEDLLSQGQEVTVKVLALDWERERLTLSLRAMQEDPWGHVAEKYAVEARVSGTVARLTPFGAFVTVEPGVDGLVHISNLGAGRRVQHPKDVLEVGQWVETYVLAVDPEKRKLSLSLQAKVDQEEVTYPEVGEILEGAVERVMPFGVFVKLPSGVTGLVPNSEMGTPRGTNHNKMFAPGAPMQVAVTVVDLAKGKVTLSRNAVSEQSDRAEFERYRSTGEDKGAAGLGSLGELLKARLDMDRE